MHINFVNEANKIKQVFGDRIINACYNKIVPKSFIAGLIFNECGRYVKSDAYVRSGKKKVGDFNEGATRFEQSTFNKLVQLKQDGFCIIRGQKVKTYSGISQSDVETLDMQQLMDYSRSYGATQIMGWSMIKMLNGTLNDLKDSNQHLNFAVQRLQIVGEYQIKKGNSSPTTTFDQSGYFADLFRIWNTGSPKGTTYSPTYVPNGLAIMKQYKILEP